MNEKISRRSDATQSGPSLHTNNGAGNWQHVSFICIEEMSSPTDLKQDIHYSFSPSPFGKLMIAKSAKGICHMTFCDDNEAASIAALAKQFPGATILFSANNIYDAALSCFFQANKDDLPPIPLHLKGTPFQLKVWKALLQIPWGQVTTYGQIAKSIGQPGASRAVGTAVGSNPVAMLIPCHRVIRADGQLGQYMWGANRKKAILEWEMAHPSRLLL